MRARADLATLPCIAFEGVAADRSWAFLDPGGGMIRVPIRPRLSVSIEAGQLEMLV